MSGRTVYDVLPYKISMVESTFVIVLDEKSMTWTLLAQIWCAAKYTAFAVSFTYIELIVYWVYCAKKGGGCNMHFRDLDLQ